MAKIVIAGKKIKLYAYVLWHERGELFKRNDKKIAGSTGFNFTVTY